MVMKEFFCVWESFGDSVLRLEERKSVDNEVWKGPVLPLLDAIVSRKTRGNKHEIKADQHTGVSSME